MTDDEIESYLQKKEKEGATYKQIQELRKKREVF
jgi:hypothetical protein